MRFNNLVRPILEGAYNAMAHTRWSDYESDFSVSSEEDD